MAQGESPRNPLAFASVLCHGRCLASQPIHLGSEVEEGQQFKRGRQETRNCDFWKCRDFDQSANTRKSKTTMPELRERYLDGEDGVGPCVGVERSDGFHANDLKCFFHLKVSDTPHDLEVFSSPAI